MPDGTPPEEWDAEEWDCETCEWRQQRERLTEDDVMALDLYRQLSDPAVKDLGLTSLVFDAHGLSMSRQDVGALMERLSAVHRYTLRVVERAREDQREAHG